MINYREKISLVRQTYCRIFLMFISVNWWRLYFYVIYALGKRKWNKVLVQFLLCPFCKYIKVKLKNMQGFPLTKNMKFFKSSHIILHLKAHFDWIPYLFLNFKNDIELYLLYVYIFQNWKGYLSNSIIIYISIKNVKLFFCIFFSNR